MNELVWFESEKSKVIFNWFYLTLAAHENQKKKVKHAKTKFLFHPQKNAAFKAFLYSIFVRSRLLGPNTQQELKFSTHQELEFNKLEFQVVFFFF